jgi:hypothetical protein
MFWASRFAGTRTRGALRPLASGYSLHHLLHASHSAGGSASIPLAKKLSQKNLILNNERTRAMVRMYGIIE